MKTLYIILSFCFGLFMGYLLFKSNKSKEVTAFNTLPVGSETYLKQIDSIKRTKDFLFLLLKDSLSQKLVKQNYLLSLKKKVLAKSQEHINQLMFRLKADSLASRDTSLVDSLSMAVRDTELQTDSLINQYEDKIKSYENLLAVRDSQIVSIGKSYNKIYDLSKEQTLQEQKLTTDLNSTLKALNRKRIQNKIWAGGMLFISGVATTLFIKSRQ